MEIQRNPGARIREITIDEAVEITEVRMVVEGLVARQAAELATDKDVAELEQIGADMREAVAAGEPIATATSTPACTARSARSRATAPPSGSSRNCAARWCATSSSSRCGPGAPRSRWDSTNGSSPQWWPGTRTEAELAMRAHITSVIEALRNSP